MSSSQGNLGDSRHSRRRIGAGGIVIAAVAVGVATALLVSRRGESDRKWSVLLITLDTTRADHLGCYGYPHAQTPTIDAISREGVRYDRCYCPVPLTLPSHSSIMTGLLPPRHGIRVNGAEALDDQALTLAEVLKQHGYATGAVVGAFVLDRQFGLEQGFDCYSDDLREGATPSRYHYAERNARRVTDAALSWLKQNLQQPTFLWVHYFDPHAPYGPPGYDPMHSHRTGYDAEIDFVDSQIRRLVDFLDEADLSRRTLVVITADHGEGLWEHGEPTHGLFVYDATLRVPLIIRFPDRQHAGTTVPHPVSLVDIFPSVVEWLDLPSVGGTDGRLLALGGQTSSDPAIEGRDIYFENHSTTHLFGWNPLVGIIAGSQKYIHAPHPEVYDLVEDPLERANLYGSSDESYAVLLRGRLSEMMDRLAGRVSLNASRIGLTHEDVSKLRDLGYVAGGASIANDAAWQEPRGPDPKEMVDVYQQIHAALSLVERGEEAEGVDILISIITSDDPANKRAIMVLAELALNEQVRSRVIECLKPAMVHRFDALTDLFVRRRLGVALAEEKRYAEAAEIFELALEIDPDDVASHWYLAGVLGHLDAPTESILRHLECAVKLAPENTQYITELAQTYRRHGDVAQAIAVYETALGRRPNDPFLLNNLAWTLATQGRDLSRSLGLVAKAIDIQPDEGVFHDTRGYILLKLERPREAREALRKAVQLSPEHARAHYDLGLACEALGEHSRAAQEFRQALELAGDSAYPWIEDARARASGGEVGP